MQNNQENVKIQNQQTDVTNSTQLNDRDYCESMLSTCKRHVDSYAVALNEASNDKWYNELFHIFQETSQMQRKMYNLMFEKGWYTVEAEPQQKIMQTVQKESTKKQQIQ